MKQRASCKSPRVACGKAVGRHGRLGHAMVSRLLQEARHPDYRLISDGAQMCDDLCGTPDNAPDFCRLDRESFGDSTMNHHCLPIILPTGTPGNWYGSGNGCCSVLSWRRFAMENCLLSISFVFYRRNRWMLDVFGDELPSGVVLQQPRHRVSAESELTRFQCHYSLITDAFPDEGSVPRA